MAERVKQDLLRRIMQRELAPGARLVELQIARDLNTSQGPVREALRELEAMELGKAEPYKETEFGGDSEGHPGSICGARITRRIGSAIKRRSPPFKGSVVTLRGNGAAAIRTCSASERYRSLHSP